MAFLKVRNSFSFPFDKKLLSEVRDDWQHHTFQEGQVHPYKAIALYCKYLKYLQCGMEGGCFLNKHADISPRWSIRICFIITKDL